MKIDVSLEKLLEAGAHFGHQAKRWNPKMAPYLYGVKEGVHIFDLVKTREALLTALDVLKKAEKEGKVILFVGTKKQAKDKVKEIAQKAGVPFVAERWLGGTLTNFEQIGKTIKVLHELKEKMAAGEFRAYTKKERLLIDRRVTKMEKFLGGIASLEKLPDLIVVVDVHKEAGAVREAKTKGIETIGIVDSNSDPEEVTWPIPMNDDAPKALEYVLDLMGKSLAKK